MEVKIKAVIFRPCEQVFDAIVNPDKITGYFASASSGPLLGGQRITWEFADAGVELEVDVLEVVNCKSILFEWAASGKKARVEITLEAISDNQCGIEITEGPFSAKQDDIVRVIQQTQGWTDFICSLKAYLYTGVNLRNGQMN